MLLIVDGTRMPVHLVSMSKSFSPYSPFPGLMVQNSPDRLTLIQRLPPYIHVVHVSYSVWYIALVR